MSSLFTGRCCIVLFCVIKCRNERNNKGSGRGLREDKEDSDGNTPHNFWHYFLPTSNKRAVQRLTNHLTLIFMEKTYSELVALRRLKEIAEKNGGLINGNFTAVANQNKVKVKRLRELYEA